MKHPIIPIFVPHLGCPHDCVFCNQRKIAGTVQAPTPEEVRKIAEQGLCVSGQPAEIAFYGGSFTAIDPEFQEELLRAVYPFVREGLSCGIRVSTRPDCIDHHTLERLKRYGVSMVELGAQSMDDEVLRLSNRGHTKEDIISASRQIKAAGLKLGLQVMCGLPGDTREKDVETAKAAAELCPDAARIYPVVVVSDTTLFEWYKEGKYIPLTVEEACGIAADMLEVFEDADITVIRIGLNPTEELSNGAAVAGAYHPALGEMARSRLYYKRAVTLLAAYETAQTVLTLGVNPSCVSLMTGQKRENIKKLESIFSGTRINVKAADVPPGKVILANI